MRELIKCPNCGESYYTERYTTSTAMYFPPVWKNGVNLNPDRNIHTTYCTCMNCHKEFSYSTNGGEKIEYTLTDL